MPVEFAQNNIFCEKPLFKWAAMAAQELFCQRRAIFCHRRPSPLYEYERHRPARRAFFA